jgi:hypothetical protein
MKSTLLTFLLLACVTASAFAKDGSIDFTPVSCLRAGELPLLQLSLKEPGILRAYFRHVNTTDWCSVEGTNNGPLSNVTLPKFENGDEIEYFFLVIDGKRVVAKSPQIYRAKVANSCETPFARHSAMIMMDCGNGGPGSIPASMGAGYSVKGNPSQPPSNGSPDSPTQ